MAYQSVANNTVAFNSSKSSQEVISIFTSTDQEQIELSEQMRGTIFFCTDGKIMLNGNVYGSGDEEVIAAALTDIEESLERTDGRVSLLEAIKGRTSKSLTIGTKTFDGSQAVEITPDDLNLVSALHLVGKAIGKIDGLEVGKHTTTDKSDGIYEVDCTSIDGSIIFVKVENGSLEWIFDQGSVVIGFTNNSAEYCYDINYGWFALGDANSFVLKGDVYTKTEVDGKLDGKLNKSVIYYDNETIKKKISTYLSGEEFRSNTFFLNGGESVVFPKVEEFENRHYDVYRASADGEHDENVLSVGRDVTDSNFTIKETLSGSYYYVKYASSVYPHEITIEVDYTQADGSVIIDLKNAIEDLNSKIDSGESRTNRKINAMSGLIWE